MLKTSALAPISVDQKHLITSERRESRTLTEAYLAEDLEFGLLTATFYQTAIYRSLKTPLYECRSVLMTVAVLRLALDKAPLSGLCNVLAINATC